MWSIEINDPAPAPDVFRRICRQDGAFWLDDAIGGRASFMSFAPAAQLRIDHHGVAHHRDARGERIEAGDPAEALDLFVRAARPLDGRRSIPHTVGFLGYGFGPWLEPHVAARRCESPVPVAHFARYDAVLACEPIHEGPDAPCRLVAVGSERSAVERLASVARGGDDILLPQRSKAPARLLEAPSWPDYHDAVRRALAYVASGDVYQVNLARRFRIRSELRGSDAYLRLRAEQPVRFGAFFDCGGFAVLSNSPERFLEVRGSSIRTEPIKGTRRRDADPGLDRILAAELQDDPKERAEHVMIVDLERNDLGRVCERGSVRVTSLLRLESFATLHHLVSTIEGRLRADVDLANLLRATFPGGSITGAPKIRATQVIAELEPCGRELYTGALFAFRAEDDFDSSIAIRTAVERGGVYTYHAGGGIVADSEPAREYAECWLKARVFLSALLGPALASRLIDEAARTPLRPAAPRPTGPEREGARD